MEIHAGACRAAALVTPRRGLLRSLPLLEPPVVPGFGFLGAGAALPGVPAPELAAPGSPPAGRPEPADPSLELPLRACSPASFGAFGAEAPAAPLALAPFPLFASPLFASELPADAPPLAEPLALAPSLAGAA